MHDEEVKTKIQELLRYNLINDEKIEAINQSISQIKKDSKNNTIALNGASVQILNTSKEIEEVKNKFSSLLQDLVSVAVELKEAVSKQKYLFDCLKASNDLINKLSLEIASTKQSCDLHSEIHEKKLSEIEDKLADLKSNINQSNVECDLNYKINHDFTIQKSKELESKIEAIKIPDVSRFIDTDELNELKREFNLCVLDSKNANLKCVNLDSQLAIISKKLETVQIYLKTIEIHAAK